MSMWRKLLAIVALVVLVALLAWQWRRERLVSACLQSGGVWDGRQSRCLQPLPSPLLRRGIERG